MSSLGERASQALRFDELEGRFDAWLLCIGLALVGVGVVMVASSSMPYAMSNGAGPFYYLIRHVLFLALGCAIALVLMRTEMRRIEARSQLLLLLCFLLLVAVFVPGVGARSTAPSAG
jgi:cell division protein FtsW